MLWKTVGLVVKKYQRRAKENKDNDLAYLKYSEAADVNGVVDGGPMVDELDRKRERLAADGSHMASN